MVLVADAKARVRRDAQEKVMHDVCYARGARRLVALARVQAEQRMARRLAQALDLGGARERRVLEDVLVEDKQHVLHKDRRVADEPAVDGRQAFGTQIEHGHLERRVEALRHAREQEEDVLRAHIGVGRRGWRCIACTPPHRQQSHVDIRAPVVALPHAGRQLAARKARHRREQLERDEHQDIVLRRITAAALRPQAQRHSRVQPRHPRPVKQALQKGLAVRVVRLVRGQQHEQLRQHLHWEHT